MIQPQPYKGTRDFYPQELNKRRYIFDIWRRVLNSAGYQEYDTSIMENAQIYIEKSGEELGKTQLYSFEDKGGRLVALRPEMTPSLARIVANRFGELEPQFPLKWFSIPNCFRYERPQKGRLREFWQLNVDIIGVDGGIADLEILVLVDKIFKSFKAPKESYTIRYNHRGFLDKWLSDNLRIDTQNKENVYKILDNWQKYNLKDSHSELTTIGFDATQIKKLDEFISNPQIERGIFPELDLIAENINTICPDTNFVFDPTIVRGLAYYTGLVFEAYDNNSDNPRALFGGGRYDNLLDMFGKNAPAIGFGWGDVTMSEFLTNWNLWPEDKSDLNTVGIMIMSNKSVQKIYTEVIPNLESKGQKYVIDYDLERNENKRWKNLKKQGAGEIIKI